MLIQIDEVAEDIDIVVSKTPICLDSETQTVDRKYVDASVQTENTGVIKEMYSLIPQIVEYLSEQGAIHITRLVEYMKLLASRSFPLSNICYRVFMDLIQWESLSRDKRRMRHSPEVF